MGTIKDKNMNGLNSKMGKEPSNKESTILTSSAEILTCINLCLHSGQLITPCVKSINSSKRVKTHCNVKLPEEAHTRLTIDPKIEFSYGGRECTCVHAGEH